MLKAESLELNKIYVLWQNSKVEMESILHGLAGSTFHSVGTALSPNDFDSFSLLDVIE